MFAQGVSALRSTSELRPHYLNTLDTNKDCHSARLQFDPIAWIITYLIPMRNDIAGLHCTWFLKRTIRPLKHHTALHASYVHGFGSWVQSYQTSSSSNNWVWLHCVLCSCIRIVCYITAVIGSNMVLSSLHECNLWAQDRIHSHMYSFLE